MMSFWWALGLAGVCCVAMLGALWALIELIVQVRRRRTDSIYQAAATLIERHPEWLLGDPEHGPRLMPMLHLKAAQLAVEADTVIEAEIVDAITEPILIPGAADRRRAERAERERDALLKELDRKELLRQRYLRRVRRVEAAYHSGGDIFMALHPSLARAS